MLQFRCPDKPIQTTPKVVQTLNENEWIASWKYDGWRLNIYYDDKGQLVRVLPQDIAGLFDIQMPDFGSTFSNFTKAQDMKDILVACLQNPDALAASGIGIKPLLTRYFWLIGLKNASEFTAQAPPQIQVMPDQQILQQAAAGNIQPMPQAGGPM